MNKYLIFVVSLISTIAFAQTPRWRVDGNSYYCIEAGEITQYVLPANTNTVVSKAGTREHISTLFTNYLHTYCPPGGR